MKSFLKQVALATLWCLGALGLVLAALTSWFVMYNSDVKFFVAFSVLISGVYWFWLFQYVENVTFPVIVTPKRLAKLSRGEGVKAFKPGWLRMKFDKQPNTLATYMVIVGKPDYNFGWTKMVFLVDASNLHDNPALVNLFNFNKQAGEQLMSIVGSENKFGTSIITMDYIQKHYKDFDGFTSKYAA